MTTYSYFEACEMTVTRAEAEAEIKKHFGEFSEFLADVGDREEYEGKEVLDGSLLGLGRRTQIASPARSASSIMHLAECILWDTI
jgi:hypothetical protein